MPDGGKRHEREGQQQHEEQQRPVFQDAARAPLDEDDQAIGHQVEHDANHRIKDSFQGWLQAVNPAGMIAPRGTALQSDRRPPQASGR